MLTPMRDLVPDKKKSTPISSIILGVIFALFFAYMVRSIIHNYFFYPYVVQNDSMSPSLKKGQKVTIFKGFDMETIKRGDILVLQHPAFKHKEKLFIARVVALPGEFLKIKNREVFINQKPLRAQWELASQKSSLYNDKEPLKQGNQKRDQYNSLQIPQKTIFVLQDNRVMSIDSRRLGPLSFDLIRGHITNTSN